MRVFLQFGRLMELRLLHRSNEVVDVPNDFLIWTFQHQLAMNTLRFSSSLMPTLLVLTWSQPAAAYIDGGTGSLIFQAAVSGVLGGLFVMRTFWNQLIARRAKVPVVSENEPRA